MDDYFMEFVAGKVICSAKNSCDAVARQLADKFDLEFTPIEKLNKALTQYALIADEHALYQYQLQFHMLDGKTRPVVVDFNDKKLKYRVKYGGGKKQAIARAIGLKSGSSPITVMDLTAGLGKDAFIMAALGCQVVMLERNVIIAALLMDGLRRLQFDDKALSSRMTLLYCESSKFLDTSINSNDQKSELQTTCYRRLDQQLNSNHPDQYESIPVAGNVDVLYLDPMYPHRSKSALVKKEMRFLRNVVGDDEDAELLLASALKFPVKRIVVKRPGTAPEINATIRPSHSIASKNTRYDVYCKSI